MCQLKSLQNENKNIDKFAKSNYIINRVYELQIKKEDYMFRNLEAEQARYYLTNQQVADKLKISRVSYENKKKSGKFTALEAKKLCMIFKSKFDYLFETDEKDEK